MAELPWDDWIYDLSYRRDEVNNLYNQAVDLQNQIQKQVIVFNGKLTTYQTFVAGNSVLVVAANVIKMSDLQYQDYTVELSTLPEPDAETFPEVVGEWLLKKLGEKALEKGVAYIGQLAKSYLTEASDVTEELGVGSVEALSEAGVETGVAATAAAAPAVSITAETVGEGITEEAAESVIGEATLDALGELGIGIFAKVGIDIIFAAINGAKEADQLDDQIASLQSAISKCQMYLETITSKQATMDSGIADEEQRFGGIVQGLADITGIAPAFSVPAAGAAADEDVYVNALNAALSQYGVFLQMRDAWVSALARNPQVTEADFLTHYVTFSPVGMDQDVLQKCWNVMEQYSDSMKAS